MTAGLNDRSASVQRVHPRTIFAAGDSITAGCSPDLNVAGVPSRSWAQWVALATGAALTVVAEPGASSARIRQLVGDGQHAADLALVYVGVNNVTSWKRWRQEDLSSDLAAILNRISADRVLVMQLPKTLGRTRAVWPYGPGLAHRVRAARLTIAEVAAANGATVIEPPDMTGDRSWIDGIHPTSVGHLAMADEALAILGLPPASALHWEHSEGRADMRRFRRKALTRLATRQAATGTATWLLARRASN